MAKVPTDIGSSSSTFTSSNSSPLDTPEINEQELTSDEEELEYCDNSDHEISRYLKEDDEDSLPEAPEPAAILLLVFQWENDTSLHTPEEQSNLPFPSAQPSSPPFIPPAQTILTPAKPRAMPASIPKQTPKIITMSVLAGNPPPVFHRRDDENSAHFIWSSEGYIIINHIMDEPTKILLFNTFISARSDADM